jgi:hypothetical protein
MKIGFWGGAYLNLKIQAARLLSFVSGGVVKQPRQLLGMLFVKKKAQHSAALS